MVPNQNEAIYLPQDGVIEVASLMPIINTPHFQRLRHRKQLGLKSIIFPSAIHTRMEHSFGSLAKIRRVIKSLAESKPDLISPELARALEVYALLHDIGHGPFSHVIERIFSMNHKQHGALLLKKMEPAIQEVANYELVTQLYQGNHPFHVLVSDTIFGTDKMDYLRRDAATIGLSLSFDIDMIIASLRWLGDGFGIKTDAVFHIMDLRWMYLLMYTQIYWHPDAVIAERMMERTLLEELQIHPELSEQDIYQLTDEELTVRLRSHSVMNRLLDERRLFRVVGSIVPTGNQSLEKEHYPTTRLTTLSETQFSRIRRRVRQKSHKTIEDQLAAILDVPAQQLLLSTPMDSDRLILQDIDLVGNQGNRTTLITRFPAHQELLSAVHREYLAFRIACDPNLLPLPPHKIRAALQFLTQS